MFDSGFMYYMMECEGDWDSHAGKLNALAREIADEVLAGNTNYMTDKFASLSPSDLEYVEAKVNEILNC